jgi:AcrR family transcriptional regulator
MAAADRTRGGATRARGGAAGTGRKRAAHLGPERRRPEVLDAALKLFLEGGYEGTSMEAVARAVGVTKPVVYACFPGKEELFRALLRREEERILTEIQSAFAGADLSDAESTLIDGYTAFLGAVASSPEVYRLIFLGEGGGNAAVARRIQAGREAQVEQLSALARTWLAARGTPEPERDRMARMLGNTIAGIAESGARLLLSGADEWTPETLGRHLGRLTAAAQTAL